MPWKEDEESGAVVRDEETNDPIWVGDDGKEIPIQPDRFFGKINELNTESAGRRKALQEAQGKLKLLEGIENPEEYLEEARAALEKVKALDDNQLLEAGKVEELKAQIREAYEGKLQEKDKARATLEEKLSEREQQMNDYMIGREFAASSFVTEQTVLPPDIAQTYFGRFFQVEDGRVVGRWPDTGEPIYSETNPGEVAEFEEAIERVVSKRSDKDKILRSVGATGVGTDGNNRGKPASKWGHIKHRGQFRDAAEKAKFISEEGQEKFRALPPPPKE